MRKTPEKGMAAIRCTACRNWFSVKPHRRHVAKYCSQACCGVGRRRQLSRICIFCSSVFVTKANYVRRNGGKYCSRKCWNLHKVDAKLLVFARGVCERCGWKLRPQVLQIHHKDRNNKNNSLDNLELLCPCCHEVEHYDNKDGPYRARKQVTNKSSRSKSRMRSYNKSKR